MAEEPLRLQGGRGGRQGLEPRLCHICLRNVVKSGSEELIISQKFVSQNVKGRRDERSCVNCKFAVKYIGFEG